MRKLLIGAFWALMLTSCQKTIEEATDKVNVIDSEIKSARCPGNGGGEFNLANNRIIFESISEYEWLIDTATESQQNQFFSDLETNYGFVSLNDFRNDTSGALNSYSSNTSASRANADSIDEDFFGGLLNPDGVIEIGPYLMKIDGVNGYC